MNPITAYHCVRDPRQARDGMEEKFRQPPSELPAQAPVPTHRYKPREVRRQGYPRRSRSPSRRVVVKLGSWPACADGVPRVVGRRLQLSTISWLQYLSESPHRVGRSADFVPSTGGRSVARGGVSGRSPAHRPHSRQMSREHHKCGSAADFAAKPPAPRMTQRQTLLGSSTRITRTVLCHAAAQWATISTQRNQLSLYAFACMCL